MPRNLRAVLALAVAFVFAPAVGADTKRDLERASLRYFLDNAHPDTGLVLDRADNFLPNPEYNRVASIAATGFGLTVIANAGVRGLIPRATAAAYCLKTLTSAERLVPRYHGWFLHFVDWQTGARQWGSEYSTIDTALFIAGALYAARVFPENAALGQIAERLYTDMDFEDLRTDGGRKPNKMTLSMAFTEGVGYLPAQWNMYAEERLLLVLGLGHPTKPLPIESWLAWERNKNQIPDPFGTPQSVNVMGLDQALFVHQYSELYLDFRKFRDRFGSYFNNGQRVSNYHRKLGRDDGRFKTLREGFWGFSAGDSPTGYKVWSAVNYQSTVCIGCALASLIYMPQTLTDDMERWKRGPYGEKIWGRYGFSDSVDLDRDWVSPSVIAITVGPAYLALADLEEDTSIWREFSLVSAVQRGMARAQIAHEMPKLKLAPLFNSTF